MCRRPNCNNPAVVTSDGDRSKYCSKECGVLFFTELAAKSNAQSHAIEQKAKSRRKSTKGDDYDQNLINSGPLSAGQIKAIVSKTKDSATFRNLGNGILNPVTAGLTESYNAGNIAVRPKSDLKADPADFYDLTQEEKNELDRIAQEKDNLRSTRATLKDRERFVSMAKERHTAYAEREGIKPNQVCGFDSRLSWNESRFSRWRKTPAGILAFERGSLDIPSPSLPNGTTTAGADEHTAANGTNGVAMDIDNVDSSADLTNEGMCQRKRCERHKQWQKLQLEDVRFEESGLADKMRELDRKEREVKDVAQTRWRKEHSGLLARQGAAEVV